MPFQFNGGPPSWPSTATEHKPLRSTPMAPAIADRNAASPYIADTAPAVPPGFNSYVSPSLSALSPFTSQGASLQSFDSFGLHRCRTSLSKTAPMSTVPYPEPYSAPQALMSTVPYPEPYSAPHALMSTVPYPEPYSAPQALVSTVPYPKPYSAPQFGVCTSLCSAPGPESDKQDNKTRRFGSSAIPYLDLNITADDALAKALMRAAKSRPALFGKSDKVADSVLQAILPDSHKNSPEMLTLLQQLSDVEKLAPAVAALTRSLFNALLRPKVSADDQQIPKWPKMRESEEDQYDKHVTLDSGNEYRCEAPECGAIFDNRGLWRKHFAAHHMDWFALVSRQPSSPPVQPPPSPTSYLNNLRIPRHHWSVEEFVSGFSDILLNAGLIHHREGAKVLCDHIVNEYWAGNKDGLKNVVFDILDLDGSDENTDMTVEALMDCVCLAIDGRNASYALQVSGEESDPRPQLSSDSDVPASDDDSDGTHADNSSRDEVEVYSRTYAAFSSRLDRLTPLRRRAAPLRRFDFFEIPAELRNWVYRELLAPGFIGLSYRPSLKDAPYQCQSQCSPAILVTCKQIRKEATAIMYEENTVCISAHLRGCMAPVIQKRLLPDEVLSRLTSVTIVFDASKIPYQVKKFVERSNWTQLQDMTKLKELRICVVDVERNIGLRGGESWMLEQVIERVPASCEITYESRGGFEDEFTQAQIDDVDAEYAQGQVVARRNARNCGYEVDEHLLESVAKRYLDKQGCKSGHKRDYRFPERGIPKTLKELVAASEVDPRIVLGGGKL